jgi:hypothetical protein
MDTDVTTPQPETGSSAGPAPFNSLAVGPMDSVRATLAEQRHSGCPLSPVAPGLSFVSQHETARQALLGSELARLEISAALTALLDRLPGLRLADGASFEKVQSPMFCGPQRLDVVW